MRTTSPPVTSFAEILSDTIPLSEAFSYAADDELCDDEPEPPPDEADDEVELPPELPDDVVPLDEDDERLPDEPLPVEPPLDVPPDEDEPDLGDDAPDDVLVHDCAPELLPFCVPVAGAPEGATLAVGAADGFTEGKADGLTDGEALADGVGEANGSVCSVVTVSPFIFLIK